MKVSKDKDPGRKRPWKLDGYYGGRRVRLFFSSKAEAEAERTRLSKEGGEAGPEGDRLSPRERIVFAELRDRLAAVGATMEEAVAFFLEHGRAPLRPMRMRDLMEAAIDAKDREGKSAKYLTALRCSVGQLCRWQQMGDLWAHEVARDRLEEWVEGNGWSAKTRRNYLIDVRTVFEWGKREGVVRRNPTDGMTLPAGTTDGEVGVLAVSDVRRLIAAAMPRSQRSEGGGQRSEDGALTSDLRLPTSGVLLWYVVLGVFAGLRPEREIGLCRMGDVNLEEGTVVVRAGSAKSRSRRVVDLSPGAVNLLKLGRPALVLYWREEGVEAKETELGVCPRNLRKRVEALRIRAGFGPDRPWIADGMRHSFASYHLALHQNENLLKAQMGHSVGSEVLWQHYRARVTRREAEAFWRIGERLRPGRFILTGLGARE